MFIGFSAPWLTEGFGETHEGRNGAVWGTASRSIRADGIVETRFGGRPRADYAYANHPPLIIAETLGAELVAGEHRIVTRAPAWLGSLIAVLLVAWLLVDAGISRAATIAGIAVSFGSAMFLVYGSMLDTPVTSLPFAVALLIAWQRAMQQRSWNPAVIGALAALAVLAGWQSTALLAICGLVAVVRTVQGRFARVQLAAMVAGGLTGLAVTLAWVRWSYGSLEPLVDISGDRRRSLSLSESMSTQLDYLLELAPWALALGVIGLVFAAARPGVRWLAVVCIASTAGYALLFSQAAEIHDYWNFSLLLPLAIGVASLAQEVLDRASESGRRACLIVVTAIPLLCLVSTLTRPSDAEDDLRYGLATPHLIHRADELSPRDRPAVAYLAESVRLPTWIDYESGRPSTSLADLDTLNELARQTPSFPVLILIDATNKSAISAAAIAMEGPYALVTARDASEILGRPPN